MEGFFFSLNRLLLSILSKASGEYFFSLNLGHMQIVRPCKLLPNLEKGKSRFKKMSPYFVLCGVVALGEWNFP